MAEKPTDASVFSSLGSETPFRFVSCHSCKELKTASAWSSRLSVVYSLPPFNVKRATDDFRLLNGLLESRPTFSRRKNPAALTRSSVVDRLGVAVRPGDSENLILKQIVATLCGYR
jgi:hypothetical protein